ADQIRPTGEIEADERNEARALGDVALSLCRQRLNIAVEGNRLRTGRARFQERREPRWRHDDRRGADESRRQQLTPRHRALVILMQDRLAQGVRAGWFLADEHGVP